MTVKQKNIKILFHIISIIGFVLIVVLCIYWFKLGLFTSTDTLSNFIFQTGNWGVFIFIVLQIVQVVIPVIPGGITCLAGVLIFGPVYGFLYNYFGICIGCVIIFLLARKYGKPFIQSITSEKTYQKYIGWLDKGKRFDRLFAIAIFLPFSPDDFLCMLAGITKIKLGKFILIIILCKPLFIAAYSVGLPTITSFITAMHFI